MGLDKPRRKAAEMEMKKMQEMNLENGMNVLNVKGLGMMHIFVYDGNVTNITIFNAKVTKKTSTHQHEGEDCNHVNVKVVTDTYHHGVV